MSITALNVATAPEKETLARRERSAVVDNAKAIGIVLVVFGHASGLPAVLGRAIFAFHMPLFFFLSGALLSEAKLRQKCAAYLGDRARAMFVPYALFFVLAWVYWLATARIGQRAAKFADVGWASPWKGFFTGLSSDLAIVNPTLWFFPCLLCVILGYFLVRQFVSKSVATAVLGLVSVLVVILFHSAYAPQFRLLLGIDVALVAIGFYAVGHQVSEAMTVTILGVNRLRRVTLLLVAMACFFVAWSLDGAVDMQAQEYGTKTLLFFVASLSGIAGTVLIGGLLPSSGLARWLSENALIIFPTHTLFFNLFSGVSQLAFGLTPRTQAGFAYALCTTLLALVCAVPAAAILRRVL